MSEKMARVILIELIKNNFTESEYISEEDLDLIRFKTIGEAYEFILMLTTPKL